MKNELEEGNKNVEIIAVQYEESYEPASITSLENITTISSSAKGKYYKQTYRPAWESMPDFKGWLRGVQGQPTRAFCVYCQKTLHAHRLSLLKHTCTIRHQKAAQIYEFRKNRKTMQNILTMDESTSHLKMEGECDDSTVAIVEYSQEEEGEEIEQDEDVEQDEEEECVEQIKVRPSSASASNKPPISTLVIDTCKGQPVCGLQVSLYKLIDGRWTYINEGLTGSDGKFFNFMQRSDFAPGRYKLHYDVDRYFENKKIDSMYPFIEIVFDCVSKALEYNVPVLLSPYGYSTYRG